MALTVFEEASLKAFSAIYTDFQELSKNTKH